MRKFSFCLKRKRKRISKRLYSKENTCTDVIKAPRVSEVKEREWREIVSLIHLNTNNVLAKGTLNNYQGYRCRFVQFCNEHGRVYAPVSEVTICAFLVYSAEKSKGLGGIRQAKAAIRYNNLLLFSNINPPIFGSICCKRD